METTLAKPYQTAMKYGALTGIVLILDSVSLYALDLMQNRGLQYIGYLILLVGIILGTKEYRDKIRGGSISYSQALGAGVLISVFAGILLAFYTFIFVKFIYPGFIEKMKQIAEQQMIEKRGMSDEQAEQAMKYASMFMSPGVMAFMIVISYAFFGLLLSLITSAFMKKEPTSFDSMVENT